MIVFQHLNHPALARPALIQRPPEPQQRQRREYEHEQDQHAHLEGDLLVASAERACLPALPLSTAFPRLPFLANPRFSRANPIQATMSRITSAPTAAARCTGILNACRTLSPSHPVHLPIRISRRRARMFISKAGIAGPIEGVAAAFVSFGSTETSAAGRHPTAREFSPVTAIPAKR